MLIRTPWRRRLIGIEVPDHGEPLVAYGDVTSVIRGFRHCIDHDVLVRGQLETLCPLWALRAESRSDRQTPAVQEALADLVAAVPGLVSQATATIDHQPMTARRAA